MQYSCNRNVLLRLWDYLTPGMKIQFRHYRGSMKCFASLKSFWGIALLGIVGVIAASSATASTVTYNLTDCFIGGGCSTSAPWGTVTVSSLSSTEVSVSLTLASNEVFNIAGGNGAGKPLLFDISGSPTVVVSGLASQFSLVQGMMTMADGSGSWDYSIQCSSSTACGTGTSQMVTGPINFDLTLASGISPASFVQNGKSLYFASDIGIPSGGGNYATGDVGAPTATPVPLSPSLVLLSSALLGGSGLMRRRKA